MDGKEALEREESKLEKNKVFIYQQLAMPVSMLTSLHSQICKEEDNPNKKQL
jgi:hypothetical protein